MGRLYKSDPKLFAPIEESLAEATGLPFKFIGHYADEKVYALTVHSEVLARQLATTLGQALPDVTGDSLLQEGEHFHTGSLVRITFERWNVHIPVESISAHTLRALEQLREIRDELAPLINTLREKYYDAVAATASAASARREFEEAFMVQRQAQKKALEGA